MPRELFHWDVLQSALERGKAKQESRVLCELSEKYLQIAQLGAVAHDAPYFLKRGNTSFHRVGDMLHGKDSENTNKHFCALFSSIKKYEENAEVIWAFLIGMLTHHATDIIFHPLVYYYTGNYYDKDSKKRSVARNTHRLFEVYMDSWIELQGYGAKSYLIKKLLKKSETETDKIFAFLADSLPELPDGWRASKDCWKEGFSEMSFYQNYFRSNIIGLVCRVFNKLGSSTCSRYHSLFRFGRKKLHPLFKEKIPYKNPVTGEGCLCGLEEMREEAIELSLSLIVYAQEVYHCKDATYKGFFQSNVGPSLGTGLVAKGVEDMLCFAENMFRE